MIKIYTNLHNKIKIENIVQKIVNYFLSILCFI